jgi:hypothetical protein
MDSLYRPPAADFQKPKVAGLAIASLVCGLLGFVTAGLSGIAAVITGHMAISAINKSGGALAGRGMSIAGLITGYLTILILPIAILAGLALPTIMKSKMQAERAESTSNVRQIGLALYAFDEEYGTFPSDKLATEEAVFAELTGTRVLDQLEAEGLLPDVDRMFAVGKMWKGDWLYFQGLTSSNPPESPVLISPVIDGKRIVLRVDASALMETEADVNAMDLSNAVAIPPPPKRK